LLQRHGFYTYDIEDGIHRVRMSPVERFLRAERVYANRFLRILTSWPSCVVLPKDFPKPATYHARLIDIMGPDWQEEMTVQMHELAVLLDYLRERKVRVQVILPPQGTWQDGLPFATTYRAMLGPVLESRQIPVTDLSRLLPDEEFADDIHPRYSGQWKLHKIYRELALQALADMGTQLEP
jgi:hypothetical protein